MKSRFLGIAFLLIHASLLASTNNEQPLLLNSSGGKLEFLSGGKSYLAVFNCREKRDCEWGHIITLKIYERGMAGGLGKKLFESNECGARIEENSGIYHLLKNAPPQIIFIVNEGHGGLHARIFSIKKGTEVSETSLRPGYGIEFKDLKGDGNLEIIGSDYRSYQSFPMIYSFSGKDKRLGLANKKYPKYFEAFIREKKEKICELKNKGNNGDGYTSWIKATEDCLDFLCKTLSKDYPSYRKYYIDKNPGL